MKQLYTFINTHGCVVKGVNPMRLKLCCVVLSLFGLILSATTLHAQTYDLVLTVQQDGGIAGPLNNGSESYCPAAGPTVTGTGCDFSANDLMVRTNDLVRYRFSYRLNSTADTNVTLRSTLPSGYQWSTLPGFCVGAGSAISPNRLSITCNRGNQAANTAEARPLC
jgi:hypothetical protein